MDLELRKSRDEAQTPRKGQFLLPPPPHVGTNLYSPSVWGPRCPGGPELLLLG